MKKVNNINFSGRLISIEEDAYQALQNYMESLKKYFSNEEGNEEIIADIENRIAEIFYDKQTKGARSINTSDVEEVMGLIGKPEDFGPKEDAENAVSSTYNTTNSKQYAPKGRLYRNSNDKMLGGVCSGVAAYFNIDTVLVRVIFAILLFGAGVGFLLYIILWIFVPESNTVNSSLEKRLFRNSEDRIFGGVSSGLSNYFGIDVWIPRLIFAAPFIVSVIKGVSFIAANDFFHPSRFWTFSFGGTTTVVYFLLWWIIPEAKSVQEKMAMKGEKMDLNTIKTNVQDDLKNFGTKANAWGKEITQKSNEWSKNFTDASHNINVHARTTAGKIGQGFGLAIKGFALFIGGTIAFALLMSLIAMLVSGFNIWPLKAYIFENGWQTTFFWGTLLLLLLPGMAFIVWIIRRVMKTNKYAKQIRVAFGILTFIGFLSATFLAASVSRGFQYHNDKEQPNEINITQPKNKLIVKVTEPEILYSGEIPWFHSDEAGFDINRDSLKYADIKVRIDRSADSAFHIKIKKFSRGSSRKEAEERAQKIQFNYTQQDSILDLGSHLSISKNEQFRLQQVVVIIEVPVGKKIRFDQSINDKFNPINVRVSEKWINGRRVYRNRATVYDYENHFDYRANEDYIMNKEGRLDPVNKLVNDDNKTIEEEQAENDADETATKEKLRKEEEQRKKEEKRLEKEDYDRKIEEEKRKKEEADRNIEELKRKKNSVTTLYYNDAFALTTPTGFHNISFLM
jgi:phage shock protein PspC (stress-responsive transcriptional regulator)